MHQRLIDASIENFTFLGRRMSQHVPEAAFRRFGAVTAWTVDVPIPSFNRVVVTEPPAPEDLADAMSWLSDRNLPFFVTVIDATEDGLTELPTDADLSLISRSPGMAMVLPAELPTPESEATITRVTEKPGADDLVTVFAEVFGMPRAIADQLTPRTLLEDDAIDAFVGYVDDDPVAAGVLAMNDDVAGVYNIAVTVPFRRRGIGGAMTGRVLHAGREHGCQIGALQATGMAESLYAQLGFETVVTIHEFQPAN